jgi:uncharacterized protein YgiB involved in biofilm formation
VSRRRSSTQITLVLIGTVTLVGCSEQTTSTARDHYASLEDCAADWGRPESCERVQSSGYRGGFLFWGPAYAPNARNNALSEARRSANPNFVDPARQGRAIGSSTVPTSRGGFGSSSRSYTSGG